MSTATVEFNEANFDTEVLQSGEPVLVDFWAEWCQPCKMLAPEVDAVAGEFAGKVKVGKVDIDSNQQVAAKFGIQSIPTLLLFKDGEMVGKLVGFKRKDEIANLINDSI